MWGAFKETTINRKGKIYGAIQAEAFFKEESILHDLKAGLSPLPGLFTGIGLLGTFVTILLGLAELHVQESGKVVGIEGFINALSGKFGSSVVGLLAALIATGINESWVIPKLKKQVDRLIQMIHRLFPRMTTERLLLEIADTTQAQREALEPLATDLSQKIKTSVTETIKPEITKLQAAIEGLNASSQSLEALNVQSMNQTLEALTKIPSQMASSLDQKLGQTLVQSIQQATQAIEQATSEVGQRAEIALNQLPETIGHTVERQVGSPLVNRLDTMNSSLGRLESQNVEGFADALRNMTNDFRDALRGATQTEFTSMGEQLGEAARLLSGMEARANQQEMLLRNFLEDLNRGLSDQQAVMAQHTARMNELLSGMAQQVAGSSEASLNAFQDRLNDLISSTQNWTQGLQEQFNRMTNQYSESAAQEREQLGRQVGRLATDLQAVVETLQNAHQAQVQSLNESREALTARINTEAEGLTQKLANSAEAITRRLAEDTGGLSQRLNETQTTLIAGSEETFKQLQAAFDESSRRMLEGAQTRESKLQSVWGQVAQDQERLATVFTQASTELRRAMEGMEKHLGTQEKLTQMSQSAFLQLASAAQSADHGVKSLAEGQKQFVAGVDRSQLVLNDALALLERLKADRQIQESVYQKVSDQIGAILQHVGDNLVQYQQSVDATLKESLSTYGESLFKSTDALREITGRLHGALEDLSEALPAMKS